MKLKITRLLIVPVLLSLSGCYQIADAFDIKLAEQYCKEQNSNVRTIGVWFDGKEIVTCTNGEYKSLTKYIDEHKNKLIDNINKGE